MADDLESQSRIVLPKISAEAKAPGTENFNTGDIDEQYGKKDTPKHGSPMRSPKFKNPNRHSQENTINLSQDTNSDYG